MNNIKIKGNIWKDDNWNACFKNTEGFNYFKRAIVELFVNAIARNDKTDITMLLAKFPNLISLIVHPSTEVKRIDPWIALYLINEDLTSDDVMSFINEYAAEFESLELELRERLISKFDIEIGRRYLDVAYSTEEWLRTCNRFAWCDEVLSDLVRKTLEKGLY